MKKKLFFKLIIWSCSLVAILVATLAIHIYTVTQPSKNESQRRQLSRIDFKQPVDSLQANNIRSFVAQLPGVESTYFNVKDGILVYTFAPAKQTSLNVYNEVMKHGNYKAERYVVDATAIKNSCPVLSNKQSVSSTILGYFYNFF